MRWVAILNTILKEIGIQESEVACPWLVRDWESSLDVAMQFLYFCFGNIKGFSFYLVLVNLGTEKS